MSVMEQPPSTPADRARTARRTEAGRFAPSYPTGDWAPAFLAAFARTGLVARSAAKAGVARVTAQRRRKADRTFARDWARAKRLAAERLEAELYRRAVVGWDEVTTLTRTDRHGDVVATETKTRHVHDGRLLAMALQATLPEKYAPRRKVETTIKDDTAISRAQLREMLKSPRKRELLAQLAEPDPPDGAENPARAGYSAPLALEQVAELNNSGSKPVLTEPLGEEGGRVEAQDGDGVDESGEGGQATPLAPVPDGGG